MRSAPVLVDPHTTAGGVGCGSAVCVGVVDVAGLSEQGLRAQLQLVGRGESRLAAMKAQILGELGRRTSAVDAQLIASDELLSSKREAKRDVETATRLQQLPGTANALADGEIPAGHARLIARASAEGPVDETVLVKAARTQNYDRFAKTVKRHQQDQSTDDGQALLERQRQRRSARIFESPETGMFVLSAQFDRITGTRIATALTAKERELWHREDPNQRCTPTQRMADALTELICDESNDTTNTTTGKTNKPNKPNKTKRQGTNLLVLADFDAIKQQLVNARLADGTPIPVTELRDLAVDANILPSIFNSETQNLWLGRSRRTASEAQRIALTARDEHCIGCQANPLWCRAHHIIWWSHDGKTDFNNLLLVCDGCHHKIHDQGWQVHQHPKTRKFYLKPPTNPD